MTIDINISKPCREIYYYNGTYTDDKSKEYPFTIKYDGKYSGIHWDIAYPYRKGTAQLQEIENNIIEQFNEML